MSKKLTLFIFTLFYFFTKAHGIRFNLEADSTTEMKNRTDRRIL